MDDFIDIIFEVLNNLSLFNGLREIRKKTQSRFLRGVLYVAHDAGVLLLAVLIAAVIFLLFKVAALLFGIVV